MKANPINFTIMLTQGSDEVIEKFQHFLLQTHDLLVMLCELHHYHLQYPLRFFRDSIIFVFFTLTNCFCIISVSSKPTGPETMHYLFSS
jgi:hypothetical protein